MHPTTLSEPIAAPHFLRTPQPTEAALPAVPPLGLRVFPEPTSFVLPIATTSLAVHLLLVAWFGAGVPAAPVRVVRELPPAAPTIVENVQIEPEPVAPEPVAQKNDEPSPQLDSPSPVAALDLPPIAQIQAISAVPSTVPVSFGIEVKGPVRLVSDAANASGAIGGRSSAEPIALDLEAEHNLLLPPLTYPLRAKRQRLTGTVVVEFRAGRTGEIAGVRVRESSGHPLLDQAARENIQAGRWKGQPGYYAKAFEFTLQ